MVEYELEYEGAGGESHTITLEAAEISSSDDLTFFWDEDKTILFVLASWRVVSITPRSVILR